jgi:Pyruvate/2-oxoacid:ferredoxin oxidoreductase delta subunit
MKARVVKRETAQHLELTLRMFVDEVSLRLDKQACLKCEVCSLVCPREAVTIIPGEADLEIAIDPRRCVLCEICAHFCPVGAVTLTYNLKPKTIFTDHQGLAPFFPKIRLDQGKCLKPCPALPQGEVHWCRRELKLVANNPEDCPKQCRTCIKTCPRQAFIWDEAGAQVLPRPELCLRCAQCFEACESEALEVSPQFRGRVIIEYGKCPPDCLKCIDLCPVKAIAREGERVWWKTEVCSYCGVCRNSCDYDAIVLVREEVVAEPGDYSQAWDRAVAKLLNREETG